VLTTRIVSVTYLATTSDPHFLRDNRDHLRFRGPEYAPDLVEVGVLGLSLVRPESVVSAFAGGRIRCASMRSSAAPERDRPL